MKMMYIMAPAGPSAHIRALFKDQKFIKVHEFKLTELRVGTKRMGWWLYSKCSGMIRARRFEILFL